MSKNLGLKILFGSEYQKWSWVPSQLPYTTPAYIAEKIANLAQSYYGNELIIWDMFAGLGSDTYHFVKSGGFIVYATELSPLIYELLLKNLTAMQVMDKVHTYEGDCSQFIEKIQADIIYFDPPWGESFNSETDFDFHQVTLSNGKNVIDLLREICEKKCHVIIKAPLLCSTFDNLDFLPVKSIHIFRKHHVKYYFT